MEPILNTKELKHDYLYKNEALMLSSLAATPVFSPVHRTKLHEKELVEFELIRTKNEKVSFTGMRLDLQRDYPLFHMIMRKKQVTGRQEFSLSEYEMTKTLGIQNRTSNKADIDKRIKKMMSCFFEVEKYNNQGLLTSKVYSSLINRVEWNKERKEYLIEISKDLYQAEKNFDYEVLSLDKFNSFKSQYSRALFLFYETFKFLNQSSVNFPVEKLGIRLGKNNMAPKHVKQEIKKANIELIDKGYLKNVKYFIAKNGTDMCSIDR